MRRKVEHLAFWKARFDATRESSLGDDAAELRGLVKEAVSRQMVSDVPVGAFLSGGIDSSVIVSEAALDRGFPTFTISYDRGENKIDQMVEDQPYAKTIADLVGAEHTEIQVDAEISKLLPELIWHMDEPIADPAIITCYLISKCASEQNTIVLLSGQGADELFAGYPRYQAMNAMHALTKMPAALKNFSAKFAEKLPGGMPGFSGVWLRRIRRVLREINRSPVDQFLNYCQATPNGEISRILSDDFRAAVGEIDPARQCREGIEAGEAKGLNGYLNRDFSVYLPNHNLLYTDKMGMATGIEARVPLIDNELIDFANRLSDASKIRGSRTKVALKEASRGMIPDEIIDRPKAGFGAPFRKWLKHDLEELWNDTFSRDSVARRGWFNYDRLQAVREDSKSGRSDLYMLQWAALTAEIWAQKFID